ncbi:MAG: ribulose-phosphate 3-epimerase [Nitrospiraceae bacterium]|nr:ribulose-phosphate 3-epimerase [Nitrospiraceae bacterium]
MVKIAPSILSADFTRLGEEIKNSDSAGIDLFHIDIMDGHFVPNITIGPSVVKAIKKITKTPLDIHLMIENPDKYLDEFIDAGADYLAVHVEACIHLHRTVQHIKERKIKAGVSLNPATPLSTLENIISDLDFVLVMSVNPGFGGQDFIPQALDKIKALKKMIVDKKLSTLIEIDGGVKLDNAKEVAKAGADMLVIGSGFFNHKQGEITKEDYISFTKKLRNILV